MDDLGLVKAIDRLSQSVVVAVTDAAHRGLDPGFGKAFGVLDGHLLGGFNRPSHPRQYALLKATGRGLRPVFSSPVYCAVAYGGRGRRVRVQLSYAQCAGFLLGSPASAGRW